MANPDVLAVLRDSKKTVELLYSGDAGLTDRIKKRLDACIRALEAKEQDERKLVELCQNIYDHRYLPDALCLSDKLKAIQDKARALTTKPEGAKERE